MDKNSKPPQKTEPGRMPRVTILGSGNLIPNPARAGPSYLLSYKDQHLLLDLGPGSLRALVKTGMQPSQISGVCITHHHPDHTCELILLIEYLHSINRKRTLLIAGPSFLDELIRFQLGLGRTNPKQLSYPIHRLVLPGEGEFNSFFIRGSWVPHLKNSVGLHCSAASRSLVYPGDCGPGNEVIDLARDADLLILEATLAPGESSKTHLSPHDAVFIASASKCKRLILSHFSPDADIDAALSICRNAGIESLAAHDGLCVYL